MLKPDETTRKVVKRERIKKKEFTEEDISFWLNELWMTMASSPRPLTAEGIENHFREDSGQSLDDLSKALGYHTLDGLLRSERCADIVRVGITKDELDEFGQIRYSAISIEDITHITNVIAETKLHESQVESRKEFHKIAKYSTEEFHEKSLAMRERLVKLVHELIQESDDGRSYTSWQNVQTKYLQDFGIPLDKKHLRSAFPTGHASSVLEKYMHEEFETFMVSGLTGNIMINLTKPLEEILALYQDARTTRDSLGQKLCTPEFRATNNAYVDYVRERQKKELLLKKKVDFEKKLKHEDTPDNSGKEDKKQEPNMFEPCFPDKQQYRDIKKFVKKMEASEDKLKREKVQMAPVKQVDAAKDEPEYTESEDEYVVNEYWR